MSSPEESHDHKVDRWLAHALEADPASVESTIRAALRPRKAPRRQLGLAAAASVLALVGVLAVLGLRLWPDRAPSGPELREPSFRIYNSGKVVTVTTNTGQVMAILSEGSK